MAFTDKLRVLFGWSSSSMPPIKGDKRTGGTTLFNPNSPYDQYTNAVKPPYERRRRYDIYDEMDEMELVASILDAYSEDCTQIDREKKKRVWIESPTAKVRTILEDLLIRLGIEEYIEAMHRDTGKNGDDFMQLNIKDSTIKSCDWRDPRDIERVENSDGILLGFEESKKIKSVIASVDKGEKVSLTYKPWDLVHFRLYKRKREYKQKYRNVYGTSLLAGAIRITKQVKILDDMLVVRRLTKTLDTRVYKIDTGRSSVEEEVQILKRWKNALKRNPFIDPANQRFDAPFDPFTWQEDVFWAAGKENESSVDVIPGQPDVADIVDIDLFYNKFFGATRAPKGYFGFEGDIEAKATLSSQDMKWGRACNSLQAAVINGLTRLCQIELALQGIDPLKTKFYVRMVVPSVLEDLSRLEAMQTLIDAAERMASLGETLGLDSDAWREHILKTTLGMSDVDIKRFSSSGPGDDPDTEPDVVTPDADPKSRENIDLLAEVLRKTLEKNAITADPREIARAEELPHYNGELSEDISTLEVE